MNPHTPGEIRIGRQELTVLRADLAQVLPQEGCALLLGQIDGSLWRIRRVWPCRNVWEPAAERRRRFAIDPREQLLAQRWGRQRHWTVLGSAHSHPASEPVPSTIDRQLAFAPTLMLILGRLSPSPALPAAPSVAAAWELGAWWLEGESQAAGSCRRLAWRMED
ncbi:MAG: M67 family metallopeptidase [Cyanobium sp.]